MTHAEVAARLDWWRLLRLYVASQAQGPEGPHYRPTAAQWARLRDEGALTAWAVRSGQAA